MWLSGLHIPESYLTALVQDTCRKNRWPLDKSTLYTSVTEVLHLNHIVHGSLLRYARQNFYSTLRSLSIHWFSCVARCRHSWKLAFKRMASTSLIKYDSNVSKIHSNIIIREWEKEDEAQVNINKVLKCGYNYMFARTCSLHILTPCFMSTCASLAFSHSLMMMFEWTSKHWSYILIFC